MKNSKIDYIFVVIGAILMAAGVFLVKTFVNPQGILSALPYVCVGISCGVFGQGMGNIISRRAIKNSLGIQKKVEINRNDERNIAIANRAKAKAYDMMTFVFGSLIVSFVLMGISKVEVLLLVFSYLFVKCYGIYYRCKYDKDYKYHDENNKTEYVKKTTNYQ